MKKLLFTLLVVSYATIFLSEAQNNVGIGTLNPVPSAILELQANNKGLLISRMDSVQRNAILNPAKGLLVYDTDYNNFWFFDGVNWVMAIGPQGPAGVNGLNGTNGTNGINGQTTLVKTTVEPTGLNCATGGVKIEYGLDANNNNTLDAGEINITLTSYVCNGAQGIAGPTGATGPQGPVGVNGLNGTNGINGQTTLVKTTAEPTGLNCATGGVKIEYGLDANNNNTLDAGEINIALTKFVCNGAQGIAGTTGATGPQGPAGVNGLNGTNGTNGINGQTTLVKTTVEPTGLNCATGGVKIEYGLDANNNNTLDAGEINIALTKYVCNGVQGVAGPQGPAGQPGPVGCTTANNIIKSNGITATCSNITDNGTSIGINSATPPANAALDVFSTTQGLLPPRLTTAQRNNIISPQPGLMIYNSDANCMEWFNGSGWYNTCIGGISAVLSILNCSSAVITGTLNAGQPASGVTAQISYTGGNGGLYIAQSVNSTGVTGLTANIGSGSLATGNGNVIYSISGTPVSSGVASFLINLGGQSCTLQITVNGGFTIGTGTTNTNWPTENFGGANRCNRSATIYTKTILNQPGGFPSSGNQTITTIQWQAATTGLSDGNVKIYMENTSATSTTTSQDWSTTIINNATLVYNGPISFNKVAGNWYGVTLSTPFVWDNANNLRISVEYTSGSNFNNRSWYRSTGGNTAESANINSTCPSPLSNGSNSFFPNVRFNN